MPRETSFSKPPGAGGRGHKAVPIVGVVVLALALNLLIIGLPQRWFAGWGSYGYLGVFLVTLLANASVFVPVPYPGLVAKLGAELNIFGVAVLGAAGSTAGETTAFLVGRAGKRAVEQTGFYLWLKRQLRTPLRAFVILFLLSAPPNPFFDVAGLTAGTLGVPFPIIVGATFTGRIVRMLLLAGFGQTYL